MTSAARNLVIVVGVVNARVWFQIHDAGHGHGAAQVFEPVQEFFIEPVHGYAPKRRVEAATEAFIGARSILSTRQ